MSARRDGDELVVTLRVKGIKGAYAAPEDAWWNEKSLGQAKWEKPDNTSGYYEVQLYRGKTKVYSVSQTSAVQYNFYPYMTKTGEYTFKAVSYTHLIIHHWNLLPERIILLVEEPVNKKERVLLHR